MRRRTLPSYRLHKPSGQAVVTLNGTDIYLGRHGTQTSLNEYDRIISEYAAAGRTMPSERRGSVLSVAELVNAFRKAGVIPASHADAYKAVIKIVVRLYGPMSADRFGPLALKVVRQHMVQAGWKRKTVNDRIHSLRRIFKWGAGNELISASVVQSLCTVEALRAGQTDAPESERVEPVATALVEATLCNTSPTVTAMILVQLHTGARAGEVCIMRGCDIDLTSSVWVYRPSTHKTIAREIALGPRAQAVLRPFLTTDLAAFIFSPKKAQEERRARLAAGRKTPLSCGNSAGTNKKSHPSKAAGNRYETPVYRRAIYNACDRTFPPPQHLAQKERESEREWKSRLTPQQWEEVVKWRAQHRWHPHQLRHAFADKVRREFGLEHAQKALGHAHANITERYAQVAWEKAEEVAASVG